MERRTDIRAKVARLADAAAMVVRRTGRWLRDEQVRIAELEIEEKQHGDYVSRADRTSDKMLREGLTGILPGSGVLSEEADELTGDSNWRWIVDPLDGTTNYLSGLPLWGISVALEDRTGVEPGEWGDLHLGLIYLPSLNKLYVTRAGEGATCNGRQIEVRPRSEHRATLSHWWPMDLNDPLDAFQEVVSDLLPTVGAVRNLGSPAAELAMVAEGSLQGFFAMDMEPWDLAAGILLVEEAGGVTSDPWNRNPLTTGFPIAGQEALVKRLKAMLSERFDAPGQRSDNVLPLQ
ncbi:hypothetical protein KQI63_09310 [bacterium]|nr:hypothetical protein [bacterium]